MAVLEDVLDQLFALGFSADGDDGMALKARLFARPEPGNDRKQDIEAHIVVDEPWHVGVIFRSVAAAVSNPVALSVMNRWRDKYGTLEYQRFDEGNGYLSLVTHVPLAPFSLTDPTALVNFISVFVGRADELEEILLKGADIL